MNLKKTFKTISKKKIAKIVLSSLLTVFLIVMLINVASYFNWFKLAWLQENSQIFHKVTFIKPDTEETDSLAEGSFADMPPQGSQEETGADAELIREWEDKEKQWQTSEAAYQEQIRELNEQIVQLNEQITDLQNKSAAQQETYKNMARYFAGMDSKNAAAIMEKLDNNQVIGILGHMNKETAAEILQKLSVDKAAAISRQMLSSSP